MINNLEIFLGNKLISCDTVVPLMMSMQRINKDLRVNYSSLDHSSFIAIKKNELLYNALKNTGEISLRGSSSSQNIFRKVLLKFKLSLFLFTLFIKLTLGRVKIIHFGLFSAFPFKLLEYFFSNKIYFMESMCFIKHDNGIILDNILGSRNAEKERKLVSKNILYYNKNFLRAYKINDQNLTLMKNPRTYRTWYKYITGYGIQKVKLELDNLEYDYNKGYFIYILGYIGDIACINKKNSLEKLISKTLELLIKYGKGLPILIKPHSITDMNILNNILKNFNFPKIHITYLHPAALSIKAKLVVSNFFSITQADAYFFGATTVEFTDYSKLAMQKTNGKSANPYYVDYFINNESEKFKKVIKESLEKTKKNRSKKIYEDTEKTSEVREYLSN